jgi:ABC-type antimicrobial peptide transport system permease subunit
MPRLPSVSGPFVLADRSALGAVFDLREPGRNATEYWVRAPSSALDATLSTGAFPSLTVTRRDVLQAQLDDDPIGKGARTLLLVVALLALAVAALALVLLVVGERRDGAGELYVWEADGTRPTTLRAMLAIRMIAVAAVGIPVGVVAGLVVARVGATLVAIDAAGSTPIPPLAVTLGSAWTPAALAIGVGAGLLLGALVAARSLRERFPLPAEADLR